MGQLMRMLAAGTRRDKGHAARALCRMCLSDLHCGSVPESVVQELKSQQSVGQLIQLLAEGSSTAQIRAACMIVSICKSGTHQDVIVTELKTPVGLLQQMAADGDAGKQAFACTGRAR